MQRLWPSLAAAATVLALDRASKLWIQSRLGPYDTIEVIPGLFNIVHSENHGMAFGIGNEGATWLTRVLLIAVSIAVLGALVYSFRSAKQMPQNADAVALLLVASGAIGNLYDRVVHGQVTDFLDIYFGQYHWPAFNVADSAITVGAILLAVQVFRQSGKPRKAVEV